MTLRYDHLGKPCGLDWDVCNDGNPRPEVWLKAGLARTKPQPEERAAPKRLTPQTEAKVVRLYRDEQLSAQQVADRLGIQSGTVFKVLRRKGVATRTKAEGRQLGQARRVSA